MLQLCAWSSSLPFCSVGYTVFLHTFKKTHPSTLILHLLIPFHLSFYWTPTLKHWQIYMRNQVTFAAFHAFMKHELYLISVPALIYCWNVQSHVRIWNSQMSQKLYPTLSRGHVYCNRNPNQASACCLLQVDKEFTACFWRQPSLEDCDLNGILLCFHPPPCPPPSPGQDVIVELDFHCPAAELATFPECNREAP